MQYTIKANNLKTIINQFNVDLFSNFEEVMTQEEITTAIEAMDIFEKKADSKTLNNIRKVAYLAVNPEYQKIEFYQIGSQLYFSDNHSVIAALYNTDIKGKKDITISVQGEVSPDILSFITPVKMNETTSIINKNDNKLKEYQVNNFTWSDLEKISQNIWSNKEYILAHFYELQWDNILKFADQELWEDQDFLERIDTLESSLENLPPLIKYSNALFEVVKNDDKLLRKMFPYHYLSLLSKKSYESPIFQLEKNNRINYNEENNLILIKAKKLKENLVSFLEDKNVVIQLLQYSRDFKLYEVCNEKIRYDKDVLKMLFILNTEEQVEMYLPKDIFKDENILISYLKSRFSQCRNLIKYPFIYQDWINDKERLLKYVKIISEFYPKYPNSIEDLFKLLPEVLKNDEEVLNVFISKDHYIYEKLSDKFKISKKLLLTYLQTGKEETHDRFIPISVLQQLDKAEQMLVLEHLPMLILKEGVPKEWKNDLNLISCCGKILSKLSLSIKQLEELSNDTEKAIKVVNEDSENFKLLTESARKNPDVVFGLIEKYKNQPDALKKYEHLIPQSVWCSRKFCLNILKNINGNGNIFQKIPKEFWNDIEFIREIAKLVDNNELSIYVFNHGPLLINELIALHKMEAGNIENALCKLISQSVLESKLEEKMPPKLDNVKKHKI